MCGLWGFLPPSPQLLNPKSVCFLSLELSLSLFLVEFHWPVAYFVFFSFSILNNTTGIQKQFPLSVFVFIDSLLVSASQDAGSGYAISCINNLELHFGAGHTCLLSYFTLVCLWCVRTAGGRAYGHVIIKISRMGRLPHIFLGMGLRSSAELHYNYVGGSFEGWLV